MFLRGLGFVAAAFTGCLLLSTVPACGSSDDDDDSGTGADASLVDGRATPAADADADASCQCGYSPPFLFVVATSCDVTTSVHDYALSGACDLFESSVAPSGPGPCTVTLADGASATVNVTAIPMGCCGDSYTVTSGLVAVPDAGSVGDMEFDRGVDLHELVIPEATCADGGA